MKTLKHLFMLSLFCMISIGASATVHTGWCGDNAKWSFDTSTGLLSITGSGKMTDYYSSSDVPWYNYRNDIISLSIGDQITSIGQYVFYNCSSMKSVTIPNSVTSIGYEAFYMCSGLTSVTIPNSVTSIGYEAFWGCSGLTSQDFSNATSLRSIEYGAFAFCTSLKNVKFGNIPLNNIADAAFINCTSLAKVNFGDIPLTYIGRSAFAGCTNLSKVFFFSNTPPTLGQDCFPQNTTVYVKNSKLVTEYSKVYDFNGKIIAYPDNMMLKYQTTDGKIIPYPIETSTKEWNYGPEMIYHSYETGYGIMYFDHVLTSIGESWFCRCNSLYSISLPNTITVIGYWSFYGCENLRTIVIPEKVNKLEFEAFHDCLSLREVFFLGNSDNGIEMVSSLFLYSPAIIYVADSTKFSKIWGGRPVRSWRSGKGNGTKESSYEIENYVNLFGFSLDVMKGNTTICGKLTADITANTGVLNKDGSLRPGPSKIWEPIGNWGDGSSYRGYSGEFDGNGHTISGLYFNDANRSAVGLFGVFRHLE